MQADVKNLKGETVKSVELPAEIFEAAINIDLMHQAYQRQMANARLGTHNTKTRGEVSGGGKKPWKQKGTGRARQGSTRSPTFKGGGKVHTPKPRDYTQAMPRQMRRAALRSALSVKAGDGQIIVVDELSGEGLKTKNMAQTLSNLTGEGQTTLVLLPAKNEPIERALRNLATAKYLRANYLNIRDLLGYDKVLLPLGALEVIQGYLG
ncbi:MAG: 50S ribosomal protein L4 [Anaerolineales bacterium]|nr:50S ribosomal protein L4 [Anaerolineales bacterium]